MTAKQEVTGTYPAPAEPRRPHQEQAEPTFTPTLPPLDMDGLAKDFIDPADIDWKRVSPKYMKVRMISRAIWSVILLGITALPLIFTELLGWWNWPTWLSATLLVLMLIWQIWLTIIVNRQVRALGYSERADHLLKRQGIMFRSVRALPYGRIQYVDVNSGPIENAIGLCHVEIKTAGADGVTLPGLEKSEAERLR
ncbi:MAG: PH domain-containing protein, partial [Rothia sp. (in: high G+C Gram-positive bacteria)]|nr:PH domain-containing protein [Rothia sp. (in: high G+C Gram-positive bacteria)]